MEWNATKLSEKILNEYITNIYRLNKFILKLHFLAKNMVDHKLSHVMLMLADTPTEMSSKTARIYVGEIPVRFLRFYGYYRFVVVRRMF